MHSNVFNILMNIDATMPSGSGAISVYGGRHKVSRPFPPYEGGRGGGNTSFVLNSKPIN